MTVITIDASGLADLAARADRAAGEIQDATQRGLMHAGEIAAQHVQEIAPRRSGRLAGSVETVMEDAAVRVTVTATRDGYPYPRKVNRSEHFMERAAATMQAEVDQAVTAPVVEAARLQ